MTSDEDKELLKKVSILVREGIGRFRTKLNRQKWWGWLKFYSGARAIRLKFAPERNSQAQPPAPAGTLWFVSICIALFGLASQLYQNELDLIEYRIASIHSLSSVSTGGALVRIHRLKPFSDPVGHLLHTPSKPHLWPPWSTFFSFARRTPNTEGVDALKALWTNILPKLNDNNFFAADLVGAPLEGAVMINSNLNSAKLAGANLTGALLGGAHLSETDFTGANLSGANFYRSQELNQEQLNSAFICKGKPIINPPPGLQQPPIRECEIENRG